MLAKVSWGQGFVKSALKASVVCFALTGAATVAQAGTINGVFGVSIYQALTGSNDINAPSQQAQQGNPLITGADLIGTGTYTGAMDFNPSTNSISAFFASGGGTIVGLSAGTLADQLSSSPFNLTTVMVFTGPTIGTISGVINHDDGASLYYGAGYSQTAMSAPLPVSDTPTAYSAFSGNWELIYVEANGLPAVLDFEVTVGNANTTPLPAALPLFATGLGVLGLFGARRKRKVATAA